MRLEREHKEMDGTRVGIYGWSLGGYFTAHAVMQRPDVFRAGKPFEFLPLAGFTHMMPDPVVTSRLYGRIESFFEDKLGKPATAGS